MTHFNCVIDFEKNLQKKDLIEELNVITLFLTDRKIVHILFFRKANFFRYFIFFLLKVNLLSRRVY